MTKSLTARLTEEAQEALQYLKERNINVNRLINRILLRAASEEGWQVSLIPKSAPSSAKAGNLKVTAKPVGNDEMFSHPDHASDLENRPVVLAQPAGQISTFANQGELVIQTTSQDIPALQINPTVQTWPFTAASVDPKPAVEKVSKEDSSTPITKRPNLQISDIESPEAKELRRKIHEFRNQGNLIPDK